MSYNKEDFPNYVRTAGKITVLTALTGFLVFIVTFVYDFGAQELNRVSAQNLSATTTLTVLNTPPQFDWNAYEVVASATSSPTNSGDVIQWSALGSDSNNAPYFLLICSDNASPTPDWDDVGNGTGVGEPRCNVPSEGGTAIQWGVSAATPSGSLATVSTTTEEWGTGQFLEISEWYAWVCDDDAVNPRCNNISVQGPTSTPTGTTSSPFHINNRPVFSPNLLNDAQLAGVDPGGTVTWTSTSSDPDSVGGQDTITLIICEDNVSYNTTTNTCGTEEIASTTSSVEDNATSTFALPAVLMDDDYPAYGYIIDEHGHEALGNGLQSDYIINNVAPFIAPGSIDLNGGADMTISVPAGETTGFTLDFTLRDNNSCRTAASAGSSTEIVGYGVSVFRADLRATSTCLTDANYDPNVCYPGRGGTGVTTGVATSTWDLSCTVTSSCPDDASATDIDYTCTFPLWFVADPTTPGFKPTAYEDDHWSVGIFGLDDDTASGTMATTSQFVDVESLNALDIVQSNIQYADTEPGQNTGAVNAYSTTTNVGNTSIDQEISGESMCGTFAVGNECPVSATSTIPAFEQEYSTIAFSYGAGTDLSSSTPGAELESNIGETTSTSSSAYTSDVTYWGIAVPASITLAGSYTGLNAFDAVSNDPLEW